MSQTAESSRFRSSPRFLPPSSPTLSSLFFPQSRVFAAAALPPAPFPLTYHPRLRREIPWPWERITRRPERDVCEFLLPLELFPPSSLHLPRSSEAHHVALFVDNDTGISTISLPRNKDTELDPLSSSFSSTRSTTSSGRRRSASICVPLLEVGCRSLRGICP